MSRFRNQRFLLDEDTLRNTKFVVLGAGAIGSFFVTTLAKMGAKHILVYDDDTIEDHNIANQMYPESHIGSLKVDALKTVANSYGGTVISTVSSRATADNFTDGDIVVCCVDNMDARIAFWNHYKNRPIKFYLDGRMAAQVYRVYGVDMSNKEAKDYYEKTLYPQSEAEPERCGHKSIIYTVLQVSAQMLSQVKRFLMNEYRPTEVMYDALNDDIKKKYHMIPVIEEISAPDEELVEA